MPLRSIFLCLWIKTWECLTNNYVQEFPLQSKKDIHESQIVTRAHKSYHKIIHLPIFPLWPWIQMTGNSLNKRNMCTLFGLLLFRSCIGDKAFRIKLIIKEKVWLHYWNKIDDIHVKIWTSISGNFHSI